MYQEQSLVYALVSLVSQQLSDWAQSFWKNERQEVEEQEEEQGKT